MMWKPLVLASSILLSTLSAKAQERGRYDIPDGVGTASVVQQSLERETRHPVPITVYYDEEMKLPDLEERMSTAIMAYNRMRGDLRGEELYIDRFALMPSKDGTHDGSYFRNKLLLDKRPEEDAVYVMGQEIGFHTRGNRILFGGTTNHGTRSMIMNGNMTVDNFSVVFTHERLHQYGAVDIELAGNDTMYNVFKKSQTWDLDIGNERIAREGIPSSEEYLRCQLTTQIAEVTEYFVNPAEIQDAIVDLVLQERVTNNPEYRRAVEEIIHCGIEKEPGAFNTWLDRNEYNPRPPVPSDNAKVAAAYWHADAAYRAGKYGEAMCAIREAREAHSRFDPRIDKVIDAAEREIFDKLDAESYFAAEIQDLVNTGAR